MKWIEGLRVCAGDVYAHNILVGETAKPTLLDYGQPSLYLVSVPQRPHAWILNCFPEIYLQLMASLAIKYLQSEPQE